MDSELVITIIVKVNKEKSKGKNFECVHSVFPLHHHCIHDQVRTYIYPTIV